MISAHRYFNDPLDRITEADEASFFAGIKLANRTFKTTESGRMSELDSIMVHLAKDRGWSSPMVLDLAVSSGVTTRDLQQAMNVSGLQPSIVATDIAIRANIVELAPGIRVLIDSSARPLQFEFLRLGLRVWNRRLDYVTGYWIVTWLARQLASGVSSAGGQEVKLVSRRATRSDENFEILEDDLAVINRSFQKRFDIVRAANILNRGYFEPAKLLAMIDNIKAYARGPGTLVMVNRTHNDGTNHGTVFELSRDNALRVVKRIGAGSEIEELLGTIAIGTKPSM